MKDSDSENLLVQRTNNGPTVQIRLAGRQPSINSCVHVNGQSSQWFDVKRGTRQGETLPPYLFIICAELLASVIRQNENIHGINILDKKYCCHNLQMIQPFTWIVQENNFAHVCVSNTDVCFNVRCKY